MVMLIVISILPSAVLLRNYQINGTLSSILFFARAGAATGLALMMWELLMAARPLSVAITPDQRFLVKIHKTIGKYGALAIALHPLLYILYYAVEFGINLLYFDLSRTFSLSIFIGTIATILLIVIWVTSVSLRKRLKFRLWHLIHLITYIVIPLVLVHAVMIGTDPIARSFWYVYSAIYIFLVSYQVLFRLDILRKQYEIVELTNEADNVFSLHLKPLTKRPIIPQPGQYVYLKHRLIPETHPFSISGFSHKDNSLRITIKDLGPFSHVLETIQAGDTVTLDGPYGVFSREAFEDEDPIVILAGGIGITPFMPLLKKLEGGWNKQVHMFYGNRYAKDITFKDYMDRLAETNSNFRITHVLENSEDADFKHHVGFITSDILQQEIPEQLDNYKYFIVGPPPMMNAMLKMLDQQNIPKSKVFDEQFA